MPVRQVWSHLQQKCSYYLQITSWPALFYFHTLEAILQAQWTHCKTIHFPLLPLYSLFFSFIYLYIHSFIWLHWVLVEACWIFRCGMWDLVPWPGIEAGTPALEAQSLSHWTTREVPPPVLFCWPWATNTPCLGYHNTFPIVISKHPHFNFTIQRGTEVDYILLLQVHNKISSRFFFFLPKPLLLSLLHLSKWWCHSSSGSGPNPCHHL